MECTDHCVDQIGVIARKNAQGIADAIVDFGAFDIDVDVPGFFFGTRPVESAAREEGGISRIVTRIATRSNR